MFKFVDRLFKSRRGLTVAELMVAAVILSILALATIPVARMSVKRSREIELRRALRVMRTAIDKYNDMVLNDKIVTTLDEQGYPPTLETLVEGVSLRDNEDVKVKFLRRIPVNPFTGEREWGMRSVQDDPDTEIWGGENVYDVFSLYNSTALDGSEYKDW